MINISVFLYNYRIMLTLAFPTKESPKSFAEKNILHKIELAADDFNVRFKGRKEIKIISTLQQSILLSLDISFIPNNVTREISVFSQILVQSFEFDKYSSKPGRLFRSDITSCPDGEEPMYEEVIMTLQQDKQVIPERLQYKKIKPRIVNKTMDVDIIAKKKKSAFVNMSKEILDCDNIPDLDNYIQQLEVLISIAKTNKLIITKCE